MQHINFTSLCIFISFGLASFANVAVVHKNISLPNGSKLITDERFQSAASYKITRRKFYYSRELKLFKEINLPHIRASIYLPKKSTSQFSAITVYVNMVTGITEINFLPIKNDPPINNSESTS